MSNSFSLLQVVPSYTHVAPNGLQSLIDLALLSESSTNYVCETICPLGNSDHAGITLSIKMNHMAPTYRPKNRLVWIFDSADFTQAHNLILSTNWDIFLCDDVDMSVKKWQDHFLAIMYRCIPRRALCRNNRPPWLSRQLLQHNIIIRRRNKYFHRAKQTNQSSDI